MSAFRSFSGFVAGLVAVTTPLSSFAAVPAPSANMGVSMSYSTGNKPLDRMLSEYESAVRSKGDSAKLNGFLRESSGFKDRKISDSLRDELLKNRIDTVSKASLSSEIPSKITSASDRKTALDGLVSSMRKGVDSSYRLIVRTSLTKAELTDALAVFGDARATYLSSSSGKDQYEITFPNSGRYAKFLWTKLDGGEVPSTLFDGVEIVKPFVVEGTFSTGAYLAGEYLSSMWGITKLGTQDYQYGLSLKAKVKVGVIDTGISLTHSDLKANIAVNTGEIAGNGVDDDKNGYVDDVSGYNFYGGKPSADDDHGHGTHVAGVIWGRVNGSGVFGVDSNVSLVPLKVLSAQGYGSSYAVIDAINYAANNGIRVINMSLGGNGNPSTDSICAAISYAKSKGVLAVVAAGNENADVSTKVPAGCSDTLTVSAVDSNLAKASFSNYGSKVDVAAPGVNIYSSYPGNKYVTMAGTSMATPFVTGLAAAVFAQSPNSTPDQVKILLRDSANTLPVTSSVNIGRFVSMPKVMTSLGVKNDVLAGTGASGTGSSSGTGSTGSGSSSGTGSTGTGSNTGTWSSTGSGSTGTGATTPPTNLPPTLSVGYSRLAANTYLVTAMASDVDGTVVRYEFKNNGTLVSSGMTASVQLVITQNSTVSVAAFDNAGASTAKVFQLTYEPPAANKAPVVTATVSYPSSKLAYVAFWASDSDGTVTKVDLFLNGRLVYTVSPNATRFTATLALSRGKAVTVKVVATDNKGSVSEKSVIVQ